MSIIVETPFQNFTGLDGKPLTNGKVYIGQAGTDPTVFANQIPVFWDEALTIPAAQPLVTNGGYIVRTGTPARAYVATDYSMSVVNANGVLVYYAPLISPADLSLYVTYEDLALPTGSSKIGTILPFTGSVPRDLDDVLVERGITPQGFGADPTGTTDSGAALQKWLDAMVLNPKLKYECIGTFKTSIPLVALFSPASPVAVSWDCHIISTITTLSDILTFSNAPLLHFSGFLHITGAGNSTYSTRLNRSALIVENCSRFSYDTIRVEYTLSHGVQLTGTTSQPNGKFIQSWYCGSSPTVTSTKLSTTVASIGARTGTSGSPTQEQQISIALSIPSYVDSLAWFLRINGKMYKILTINSPTSLQVYPWIESTIIAGDTVDFIGGAGYYSIGGDTSAGRIESLDSLVCGVGFQSLSLYPTSIDNYVSQSNGASMVFGLSPSAAMTACNIDYFYSENDVFGVVVASSAAIQLQIGPTVSFPLNRSFRFSPRLTDDSFSSSFQSLGPGFSYINDSGMVRGSAQLPRGAEGSTSAPRVEGGSVASYSYHANNITLLLQDPTEINLITGLRAINFELFGTGANNQPTGTITVTPPPTHTINGGAAGASVTFTGLTKPLNLRAIWIGGTAWRIGNDIFPKAANQADSTAGTLAAMVVDFNALLAKLRSAGLM